jgi:hypothetical protein
MGRVREVVKSRSAPGGVVAVLGELLELRERH